MITKSGNRFSEEDPAHTTRQTPSMTSDDKVNILLVDDQPSKLLTYEVILRELGENLIKASSGKEALEQLLKKEIAVVLMDVSMPELEASTVRLLQSEQRRSVALAAGNLGSWDWDLATGKVVWDEGQHAIYGVTPGQFVVTPEHFKVLIVPEDWERLQLGMQSLLEHGQPHQAEFRIRRPNGEVRWCASTAAASQDSTGKVIRISGV